MRFQKSGICGRTFPCRMATFHTTKRHLSTLDPCPFEAPSLTFRPSIPKSPQPETCPTPAPPSAYGLSARPHSVPEPPKPCLPALCFTQNPDPTFPPNIFTLRSQSHRLYNPVECNGVGDEWPCAFPMLIHRRPSCRLEKFLVPLMVSSIQSSTFNRSFLQNLLISNRWFSTVCLSLLTLMYP